MRRNPKALRNTAFHESGHAVSACMLGVRFRSVSIRPNRETLTLGGVLLHKSPKWAVRETEEYNQDRARVWFEKVPQICLAGRSRKRNTRAGVQLTTPIRVTEPRSLIWQWRSVEPMKSAPPGWS